LERGGGECEQGGGDGVPGDDGGPCGGGASFEEVVHAGSEPSEGDEGAGDGGGDGAGEVGVAGAVAAGSDGDSDGGPAGELGDERVDGDQVVPVGRRVAVGHDHELHPAGEGERRDSEDDPGGGSDPGG